MVSKSGWRLNFWHPQQVQKYWHKSKNLQEHDRVAWISFTTQDKQESLVWHRCWRRTGENVLQLVLSCFPSTICLHKHPECQKCLAFWRDWMTPRVYLYLLKENNSKTTYLLVHDRVHTVIKLCRFEMNTWCSRHMCMQHLGLWLTSRRNRIGHSERTPLATTQSLFIFSSRILHFPWNITGGENSVNIRRRMIVCEIASVAWR